MPKKNILMVLSLAIVIFFDSNSARAFVAQKIGDALSFNNTSRAAFSRAPQEKEQKQDSIVIMNAGPIDYDEIAEKLLPNEEAEKFYVDMRKKSSQNIAAKPGQTFFVVLPEEDGSSWLLADNLKIVEAVSSEHNKNKRIIEFRILRCGEETFFIDNLIVKENQNKILQSKIIRLRVKNK